MLLVVVLMLIWMRIWPPCCWAVSLLDGPSIRRCAGRGVRRREREGQRGDGVPEVILHCPQLCSQQRQLGVRSLSLIDETRLGIFIYEPLCARLLLISR